jgi:NADH dehydrogenase FAD-containing subunit
MAEAEAEAHSIVIVGGGICGLATALHRYVSSFAPPASTRSVK